MTNYKKEYTDRKIAKCEELVKNATSDAQRKIYQEYLDIWTKHAKKDDIDEELEDYNEISQEVEFKKEFPDKKAYYNRDGETHLTKAFKEFLIRNE